MCKCRTYTGIPCKSHEHDAFDAWRERMQATLRYRRRKADQQAASGAAPAYGKPRARAMQRYTETLLEELA